MRQRTYTDLDLDLDIHPSSRDVSKLRDVSAIIRSVRNLVLTAYYDTPFQPAKGNFVANALFENDIPEMEQFVRNEVLNMVNFYEPRARQVEVTADYDISNNAIQVDIGFLPVGEILPVTFSLTLERTR